MQPLSLPRSDSAVYGAQVCTGGIGDWASPVGGWACNPREWWPEKSEPRWDAFDGATIGSRVGDFYNLIDVDCYDASVGGARERDVSYGALTESSCARP